jgi:hypothetical protein
LSANSEQCVEFYYYQEPSEVGRLNVYAKLANQSLESLGFPLWTETPVYNTWQIVQVSLGYTITNAEYQIIFEEYVEANKPGTFFCCSYSDFYGIKLKLLFLKYLRKSV